MGGMVFHTHESHTPDFLMEYNEESRVADIDFP